MNRDRKLGQCEWELSVHKEFVGVHPNVTQLSTDLHSKIVAENRITKCLIAHSAYTASPPGDSTLMPGLRTLKVARGSESVAVPFALGDCVRSDPIKTTRGVYRLSLALITSPLATARRADAGIVDTATVSPVSEKNSTSAYPAALGPDTTIPTSPFRNVLPAKSWVTTTRSNSLIAICVTNSELTSQSEDNPHPLLFSRQFSYFAQSGSAHSYLLRRYI